MQYFTHMHDLSPKRLKMINEEKCIYIKEKDKPDIIRDHIRRIYKETDIT